MGGVKGNRPRAQAEKLHRRRVEPKPQKPSYKGRNGEAEVVPGYQLSAVLRRWVTAWLVDHPLSQDDPQFRRNEISVSHVGPIQYLAEKTGINTRRVSGICNGEFLHVPLSQADQLLVAAGLFDLLGTNEIQVIQNPNWSLETWVAYMEGRGCI
jgi:hypothetical protein